MYNMRMLSILLLTVLSALPCRACDVPVFRYALERWNPVVYKLTVLVPPGVPAPADSIDASLQRTLDETNCTLQYVRSENARSRKEFPALELLYPDGRGQETVIWSGRASAGEIDQLVDSPARREIVRQILAGATAVWIFLDGVNPTGNDAALERLETALDRNERELSLPESVVRLRESMSGDLRIEFPVIRLSRSDTREGVLIGMLLQSEPDLESYRSEPMAFPVFGRGRVLYALVGEGIDSLNVSGACAFLAGPCACEIKDSNPGMDLLIRADWSSGLGESWVDASENVSLSSLSALAGDGPDDHGASNFVRYILLSFLIVLVLVSFGSIKLLRKMKRENR